MFYHKLIYTFLGVKGGASTGTKRSCKWPKKYANGKCRPSFGWYFQIHIEIHTNNNCTLINIQSWKIPGINDKL